MHSSCFRFVVHSHLQREWKTIITTTSTEDAKGDTKVIEYIWQEPGVIQATIAWGACRVYFGVQKRSNGKGRTRKKRLPPFPNREVLFLSSTPNRLNKEAIGIRNAASLIIGRRIFKRARSEPAEDSYPKRQQMKRKAIIPLPQRLIFPW